MKHAILFIALVALSIEAFAWGGCQYERDIERVIDLDSVQEIVVKAGAGKLSIAGGDRGDIILKARLCSDDEDALAKMDVSSRLAAGNMEISAEFPYKDKSWFGGSNQQMSIDMELTVPANLKLDVSDSSGDASVENVAALVIKDSSGGLKVADVKGDLSVIDSSGDLSIKDVGGSAIVTDSSGDLSVRNVGGNLTIDADSSGDIEIDDVRQSVVIKRDSSGSIFVSDVGGDFSVGADGSGSINYDGVAGRVTLPRK